MTTITLKTLLDANVISPGAGVITLLYKDRTTVANLLDDGTIDWGGQFFTSLSTFSLRCKRSITHRLTGATTLKTDNGWTSVRYNGEPLSDIRSGFLRPDRVIKDVGISQMKGEPNDLADQMEILQLRVKILELQLESRTTGDVQEILTKKVEVEESMDEQEILTKKVEVEESMDEQEILTKKIEDEVTRINASDKPCDWTFSIKDLGGRGRKLCCHPHNLTRTVYKAVGVNHVSDCECPDHRDDTLWRRFSGELQGLRDNTLRAKTPDEKRIYDMTGIHVTMYKDVLMRGFVRTFQGILPNEVLKLDFDTLISTKYQNRKGGEQAAFSIDEIWPRKIGKTIIGRCETALTLAKLFHWSNTQILISNDDAARHFKVDVTKHKKLINCTKGGNTDDTEAQENFNKIHPRDESVFFFLGEYNKKLDKESS